MTNQQATSSGKEAATHKTPPLLDLTSDNITPNTIRINSQGDNERLTYLMSRLVSHLHDFARETRLSTDEWMTALNFLVKCGQISSDVRHVGLELFCPHLLAANLLSACEFLSTYVRARDDAKANWHLKEFILLSDILGFSLLVDSINHPKPPPATEGSLLGPFHTHDAPTLASGENMTNDPEGEPLFALCTVKDTRGNPIPGVKIDIWETDSSGHYDVQHTDRGGVSSGRCVMVSDSKGEFQFRAIRPVSYPIPDDGPVGKLLQLLGRHCWRPAHMHFIFEKEGWDRLVTALFIRGDPYETSDAVFGVKKSLVVDLGRVDPEMAEKYGAGVEEGMWLLRYDFVLVSEAEAQELRDRNAVEALAELGLTNLKLVDHLPVPQVD